MGTGSSSAALAALLATGVACPAAAKLIAAKRPDLQRAVATLRSAAEAADEGDCATAVKLTDELLHAASDLAGATALVGRIVDPGSVIEINLDPRFRAMLPADFDLRRGVGRAGGIRRSRVKDVSY